MGRGLEVCAMLVGAAAIPSLALATPAAAQVAAATPVGDPPSVAAASVPAPRFMIRAFQVKGNHWLPAAVVEDAVYPFMGPDRSAEDVERARAALQTLFEKGGYATVAVVIPEQGVDGGIIRLEVEAQAIGQVTVSGAKNSAKVLAAAPSLAPGGVPNFQAVQRDVTALNMIPSRKVTPEVKAGVAPGTIDVNLTVDQSSPFHGTAEVNNYSSPSTTDLRVAATLRYDDLWGRGDSISVSAQTAPRNTDDGTVLSANYLLRLGKLQLLGYFVHSDSDIAVVGGASVIGKGDLGGLRLIVPLSQSESFYQSLTAGIDYKNFKEDVALGADRSRAPIEYFPITIGWRGDWTGAHAKTNLALSTTFGIRGLGDDGAAFDFKRYKARPDFFYVRAEAGTTLDLIAGFVGSARLTGQIAGAPLVSNEQFSVGGIDTVRGYLESETLGDRGVAGEIELRSPSLFGASAHNEVRALLFADVGYWGIMDPLVGQDTNGGLASIGGGVRVRLLDHLNAAFDGGVPLRSGPNTQSGDPFAKFRIWGEF